MKRNSLLKILFGSMLATSSGTLLACSCFPPPAPKEALKNAGAVFIGTVAKVEPGDDLSLKVTVLVSKIWKGVEKQETIVTTAAHSTVCGYTFQVGETYLIYAAKTKTGWSTNRCTRTCPLESAAADLAALGEGIAPKE